MMLVNRATADTSPRSSQLAATDHRALRSIRPAARHGSAPVVLMADLLALAVAVTCALLLVGKHGSGLADSALLQGPLPAFVVATASVFAFFTGHAHYSRRVPFWTEVRDLLFASLVALMFSGCVGFLLQQDHSRVLPVVTWLAFPGFAVVARTAVRRWLSAKGRWQLRCVLVADPVSARQTLAALRSESQLGYDVIAVIEPRQFDSLQIGFRWSALMQRHNADLLILSYAGTIAPGRGMIESLVRDRVPFAVMPQLEGLPVLGFEQTRFFSHDTVMFTFRNNLAQPLARLTKMVFDVVTASVGVVVLMPVLLVVAALVKLDGGPALFGHVRIGVGGRPFRCLKFRSMVVDSEAALSAVLSKDSAAAAEWLATRKLRNDPRITRIGRVLRASSLDELPQLFNVLRLEMSLVGPRPIVGAEVARYGEDIAYYYETRPGLTGLWQVSGRTDASYVQRVQLDTWYVKNWTIWHDLAILAKTIPAVLQRRGAC